MAYRSNLVVGNSHQSGLLSESSFMGIQNDHDCQLAHDVVAERRRGWKGRSKRDGGKTGFRIFAI
jgi:hypothetical protein